MAIDRARIGRNNRRRGADGEREVCALLRDTFGLDVRRRLGQERDSGHDVTLPGFSIEVKRRKGIAGLYEWLKQADVSAGLPMLFVRADGQEWLAVMRFRTWAKLAREEVVAATPKEAPDA